MTRLRDLQLLAGLGRRRTGNERHVSCWKRRRSEIRILPSRIAASRERRANCGQQQGRIQLSRRLHLEAARKAAETAVRLQPDLGEAHLELARYYYFANLHTSDFERAHDELVIS